MEFIFKKISVTEVNNETKTVELADGAQFMLRNYLLRQRFVLQGNKCGCRDYQTMSSYLSKYCR